MRVEQLDQLGEVGERAGEAVDLVDDHDVDAPGPDLVQQPLQGGPVERGAGQAAVVVATGRQSPSLVRLALDVGLAGLALRVERVEGEVEVMLGRLAGVDGAALRLGALCLGRLPLGSTGPGRLPLGRLRSHGVTSRRRADEPAGALAALSSSSGLLPPAVLDWRRPKNLWPFHLVPVIACAVADRLGSTRSFQL